MTQPRYILGGQGGSFSSSSGSGYQAWTAGTYAAGSIVSRGPYLWGALQSTSEDPFLLEGNMGSNSDWTFATAGSPGTVQTSTATDGAPNGKILLINSALGSSVATYRQSTNSGVLGKMLVVDVQISGNADWLYFGMFDSAQVQTSSNLVAGSPTGFYGLNIFIYTPSVARIENVINSTVATNVSYSNANSTIAGSGFSRWYMTTTQNGSNWDLELLRDARSVGTLLTTGFDSEAIDPLQRVAKFTNVARPSFSTWRFAMGARTGGDSGLFQARAAYVREFASGNWKCLGEIRSQMG